MNTDICTYVYLHVCERMMMEPYMELLLHNFL